jgi:hypothetical protein
MDRRNFLRSLIGGVAATAAVRTFPFRVYSFPAEIEPVKVIQENFSMFDVQPIYDIYAVAGIQLRQTLFRIPSR